MNMEALRRRTEEAEGRVDHLYLDTKGYITVGVGHLLRDVQDALELPFEPISDVEADFARVWAAKPGLRAAEYAHLCQSRLSDANINAVLDKDINKFLEGVRHNFKEFDGWPELVQQAVFDMAYNLGLAGFMKFHLLILCLHAKDWAACSQQCKRRGISDARNGRTAALFQSALKEIK